MDLYTMPVGVETRWASPENPDGAKGAATKGSDGRKRRPSFPLKAGETVTLAHAEKTSGTIRRIWITIGDRSPKMLRGFHLQMFWDGSDTPALSVPLGDFFCHTLGRMSTFQSALFSSPEGRSFNCCIPMPFRKGMKITLTNETDKDQSMVFYDVDYTVGDRHGDDVLYFHSYWHRENPTTMKRDFEILPAMKGKGRFLGVCFGVCADTEQWLKTWWGEGEVKVYLDGDKELPTLCGTGTEDYIGTAWGQGQYANLYQGCQLADGENMQYGFYRFHVPDPIYFRKDIRVTIHQIGCWDPSTIAQFNFQGRELVLGDAPVDVKKAAEARGYGLFERTDDWSSCAYFYLDRPTNELPAIPPLAERLPK